GSLRVRGLGEYSTVAERSHARFFLFWAAPWYCVGPRPACSRPSAASASSPAIVRFRPWSPPCLPTMRNSIVPKETLTRHRMPPNWLCSRYSIPTVQRTFPANGERTVNKRRGQMSVGDKLIIAGTVPAVFAVVIFTVANADYALAFISVALVAVCAG